VATPTTGREACVNQKPFPAIPVAKKIPMTAAEPSVTPLKGPRNKYFLTPSVNAKSKNRIY
jgi:hypothetical protein